MAMDFFNPATATLKVKMALNEDGNIAQSGETAAAQKVITLPGLKQNATLAEANTVLTALVGNIAGGSFDSLSASKTTTQEVGEV